MKTNIKIVSLKIFTVLFSLMTLSTFAEEPDPPILPGEHGLGGDLAVGAPLDDNLILLLVAGAAYGAYRIYLARKARTKRLQTKEITGKY